MRSPELVVDGTKVKAAREAAGLYQHELAKKVGVSREAIAQWESNNSNTAQPSGVNFKRLCRALVVKRDSLLVVPDDKAA